MTSPLIFKIFFILSKLNSFPVIRIPPSVIKSIPLIPLILFPLSRKIISELLKLNSSLNVDFIKNTQTKIFINIIKFLFFINPNSSDNT